VISEKTIGQRQLRGRTALKFFHQGKKNRTVAIAKEVKKKGGIWARGGKQYHGRNGVSGEKKRARGIILSLGGKEKGGRGSCDALLEPISKRGNQMPDGTETPSCFTAQRRKKNQTIRECFGRGRKDSNMWGYQLFVKGDSQDYERYHVCTLREKARG